MEKILTTGTSFVDEYGRERIFNGVNLCDKGWPDGNGQLNHIYEYDDKMDAMNFGKRKWHNPADEEITSDDSFYELGVKATATGVEIVGLFGSFLEGKMDCQVLLNYINDESFYTGLDYRKKMKFFKENETAN